MDSACGVLRDVGPRLSADARILRGFEGEYSGGRCVRGDRVPVEQLIFPGRGWFCVDGICSLAVLYKSAGPL